MGLAAIGKVLLVLGAGTAALGCLFWGLGSLFPSAKLGRLPGDIVIEQGSSKVFVPLTTMILASLILSLVFWLVGVLRR